MSRLAESRRVLTSSEFVVVDLMLKLRASQCLGGPLYNAGAFEKSKEVFLKMVDQCLNEQFVQFIPEKMVKVLRGASVLSSKVGVPVRDSAFMLRRSVDVVYDHFMNKFCVGVDFYHSRLAMQNIGELLNNAMLLMKDEKFEEALKVYTEVAKDMLKSMSRVLSDESRSMLETGLADAERAESSSDACQILRKCAEFSYDETRVPEEYVANSRLAEELNTSDLYDETVLVDFAGVYCSDEWDVSQYSDEKINGESVCHFVSPTPDRPFALWYGSVSSVNYGGFAGFKMIPKSPSVAKISKETVGIKIWIRNNSLVNSRFMLSLYPKEDARFHWDSDFQVPLSEDFQTIYLPIKSFWPTIYGHSLGLPGRNMNLDGVCKLGLVIARNLASGKPNADFKEGEFSLAIKKIVFVNHNRDLLVQDKLNVK